MEETMKKFNVLLFVTVTILFSWEARSQEYTPDANPDMMQVQHVGTLYHFNKMSFIVWF
jgi:hypothetical protein